MQTENALATVSNDADIVSSLVINGDVSKLSQPQKVQYYRMFCEKIGLDPLTQPFKLLKMNGKESLYCDRTGAQQLNKVHSVSHEIKARETFSGCYVVTAQASTPNGRKTESIGAVPIEGLKGDSLCNAMMKAETKAKRRATLDLLGLGILDGSEVQSIPGAQTAPPPPEIKVDAKFLITYTTVEDIDKVLVMANTVADLSSLYGSNKVKVEENPELKQRFTNAKNLIVPPVSTVSYEDLAELYEVKKEACNDELRANAERILKNREVSSFSKLHKTLSSL